MTANTATINMTTRTTMMMTAMRSRFPIAALPTHSESGAALLDDANAGHDSRRWVVHVGKDDIGTHVDVGQPLQQLRRAALGDPSLAVDDEVLVESVVGQVTGLVGDRHA